jgi:thiol-disulfide isomerase/thioredoxin
LLQAAHKEELARQIVGGNKLGILFVYTFMKIKSQFAVVCASLFLSAYQASKAELPIGSPLKEFNGVSKWLNSPPITLISLKGKVVAVEFYTSACSNCRAAVPHVVKLYDKYKSRGFIVIGIHTPELSFEHKLEYIHQTISELGITYPVGLDDDAKVWKAYNNNYWPNLLLFDRQGKLIYEHAGEGAYEEIDSLVGKSL